MEKQTPETLNLARDEKQEGPLAQISTTAAVAATIEPGIARQSIQPPEPEPGPTPPPKPEPEVIISINSPVPNATVFVPLSKGTFTVTGSVSAILLTIQKVDVQFENLGFGTVTRSGSSWSCTSSKIVASRMLTITAKVTATTWYNCYGNTHRGHRRRR